MALAVTVTIAMGDNSGLFHVGEPQEGMYGLQRKRFSILCLLSYCLRASSKSSPSTVKRSWPSAVLGASRR